jgi:hypothetical protein
VCVSVCVSVCVCVCVCVCLCLCVIFMVCCEQGNNTLQQFHLRMCGITHVGASAIAQALQANSALLTLNLSGNIIVDDPDMLSVWKEALGEDGNKTLETLDLSGNQLCTCYEIMSALEDNSSLRQLSLNNNTLGQADADTAEFFFESIGEMLSSNKTLRVLHLQHNKLGDTGVSKLIDGLKNNASLLTLHLGTNSITNVGAAQLDAALKENTALTALELGGNPIGAADAAGGEGAMTLTSIAASLGAHRAAAAAAAAAARVVAPEAKEEERVVEAKAVLVEERWVAGERCEARWEGVYFPAVVVRDNGGSSYTVHGSSMQLFGVFFFRVFFFFFFFFFYYWFCQRAPFWMGVYSATFLSRWSVNRAWRVDYRSNLTTTLLATLPMLTTLTCVLKSAGWQESVARRSGRVPTPQPQWCPTMVASHRIRCACRTILIVLQNCFVFLPLSVSVWLATRYLYVSCLPVSAFI